MFMVIGRRYKTNKLKGNGEYQKNHDRISIELFVIIGTILSWLVV